MNAFVDSLRRDLRYALRAVRRNPMFTAIAVLTLALGIGANSALFSFVHAVLLEPLPYPRSERLVRVWSSSANNPRGTTALPDYREWRNRSRSFEEIGAYHFIAYNLTGLDRPERLQATRVTASVWTVLGIQPLIGRLFDAPEEQWGRHRVVLLSEGLWRRRFGSDTAVMGKTLQLNGESYTVIGVMPAAFQFPGPLTELWAPVSFAPGDNMNSRNNYFSDVIARLKTGISLSQAQQELSGVAAQLAREVPQNAGRGVALLGLQDAYVNGIRPTLLLLFGAAGVVLLIACGNVANLLLSRASARRRELTVRMALGAGQARLIRQLLTESLFLAGLGALLGVALGYGLMRLLLFLAPPGIPRLQEVALDGTVLGFTVALGMLTGFAFGVWPAWHAAAVDAVEGLKESARGAGAARSGGRVRKLLIVAQVALSLVLLIGATLLISSLARVQRVDPGFTPDRVLTMQVNLPPGRYSPERTPEFIREVVEKLSALPGVGAAAAATALPLGGNEWVKAFSIQGRPAPSSLAQVPNVNYRQITPDYFRSMGATVRRGRSFTNQDGPADLKVAVVNETLARRFWPDADPIGQVVALLPPESLIPAKLPRPYSSFLLTIVGVVADLRSLGLEAEPNPEVFAPLAQADGETANSFFLVARAQSPPMGHAKAAEAAIHQLDANLPVIGIQAMETRLASSLARRRFSLFLMGLFAALALLLAIVGLYGVIAYAVTQRTQEMGIRAALGARASDLVRLVVGHGFVLAAYGVLLGLAAAAGLSRVIRTQLFQVEAIDPLLYGLAAALFLLLAGLSCWIPGRRAARTDPATTLRYN